MIATSVGRGSGRLLAASLRDVLNGGGPLLAVRNTHERPHTSCKAIDFVFASDDPMRDEVIRAGVNERSRVVCMQLVRSPRDATVTPHRDASALRAVVGDADSVDELRWHSDDGTIHELDLVVRRDGRVTVPCAPLVPRARLRL